MGERASHARARQSRDAKRFRLRHFTGNVWMHNAFLWKDK